MTGDTARKVADTVLYEGYVLFPYRASAAKNQYRWQWGVVIPRRQVDGEGATEPAELSCDVPLWVNPETRISVTARFLQLCHRQVERPDGTPVDRLEADDELHITWDEGHEREVRTPPVPVAELLRAPFVQTARLDPQESEESLGDAGRVRRTFAEVVAEIEVRAEEQDDGVVLIHAAVRNVTPWSQAGVHRDVVLRRSMVGTHLLMSTLGGAFSSIVDPADWASDAVAHCTSRGLYPVLAGDGGADDVVLAAPIILEDHPKIADESPGPAFDALEIDELMALAVQGLTDEEKREARATDARAADVVDTFGALPPQVRDRLHGAIREFGPEVRSSLMSPEPEAHVDAELAEFFGVGEEPLDHATVDGSEVRPGDTVRLDPKRRADAHDLFAAGRDATVHKIVRTVDGDTLLAVTLTDDPAADLHQWYGRFQYFHLDEVHAPARGEAET